MKPNYEIVAIHEENAKVTKIKVTRRGKELTQLLTDVIIDINNDAANYCCNNAKVVVSSLPDGSATIAADGDTLEKLPRF